MSRPVGRTFAVLSSRGSVNCPSGCSFIDAGRCIASDFSELTIQIECARNHARESAPISRRVLEPLPGRRPVVARNLTFEDRRHARTSHIDFWPCGCRFVKEQFALARFSTWNSPLHNQCGTHQTGRRAASLVAPSIVRRRDLGSAALRLARLFDVEIVRLTDVRTRYGRRLFGRRSIANTN
jgi:hypothetical protein